MEIVKGTIEHSRAVADLWNAKAQDQASWWYGSPTKTSDKITGLLSQGYSLVVALDHGVLMGFGMWLGPRLLGFTAINREGFYRIMRFWAQENPGERGISVIPARDTTEKGWTDALGVADVRPLGHKPLRPGDDPTTRKVWTCRAEADLDSLLVAIEEKLAETTR